MDIESYGAVPATPTAAAAPRTRRPGLALIAAVALTAVAALALGLRAAPRATAQLDGTGDAGTVSYTHLTLPTKA